MGLPVNKVGGAVTSNSALQAEVSLDLAVGRDVRKCAVQSQVRHEERGHRHTAPNLTRDVVVSHVGSRRRCVGIVVHLLACPTLWSNANI